MLSTSVHDVRGRPLCLSSYRSRLSDPINAEPPGSECVRVHLIVCLGRGADRPSMVDRFFIVFMACAPL